MPDRIQLSRRKGWRKPAGVIVVARPMIWGNPFTIRDAVETGMTHPTPAFVVDCYREWLAGSRKCWMSTESDAKAAAVLARLPELRGHDLACWCPLHQPCHADVLLEIANR